MFALFLLTSSKSWGASYCSASATNGQWALYHSNYGISYTCSLAFNSLFNVDAINTGVINENTFNVVFADCGGILGSFSGFGLSPLNEAFYAAKAQALAFCLFHVN